MADIKLPPMVYIGESPEEYAYRIVGDFPTDSPDPGLILMRKFGLDAAEARDIVSRMSDKLITDIFSDL